MIHVYKLDSLRFIDICNDYPDFRRYILMRANLRRAHFIKVFEENGHYSRIEQMRKNADQDTERDGAFAINVTEQYTERETALFNKVLNRETSDIKSSLGIEYDNPFKLRSKINLLKYGYLGLKAEL